MKFTKAKLYTNKLQEELNFYTEKLQLPLIEKTKISFTIKVGWTELTFAQAEKEYKYHYCFLIPSNKLQEALAWINDRADVINIERDRQIEHSESWNADSIYFYDASGNVSEFIVRYDLENDTKHNFDQSQILCVNEIGLPTTDIDKTNKELNEAIGSQLWKGNKHRFGTHGNQEGIFLLANYLVKETWFPTPLKIKANPFRAVVQHENIEYLVDFKESKLSINK